MGNLWEILIEQIFKLKNRKTEYMEDNMPKKQRKISILNDVLGPIMHGPSSSHSAAPYAIARTCRQLSLSNGENLLKASIRFDYDGSFAQVHEEQ